MLKYIWRDKKQLIIIIGVILVCSIAIPIGIYAQIAIIAVIALSDCTAKEHHNFP